MKTFAIQPNSETASYDYLASLSRDRWAWEYARRNDSLIADAAQRGPSDMSEKRAPCADIRILRSRVPQTLAERWGLVFMPGPELNGLEADAVWSHYVFPDQVEVDCTPRNPGQSCDIWDRTVPYCSITHVTDGAAREYLLIRRNGCIVQVRCTGMSLLSIEPVRMKLQISDIVAFEGKHKRQREALRLYREGPDLSAIRWTKTTQILRNGVIALDCLKAGMSQREIASLIYGPGAVAGEWGTDVSALRASLRYVIRKAEGLRDGGYLVELLGARMGGDRQAA
ncbi:MAG: DNA -binding domain-containing protein [Hyphomonas sp.]